MIQVLKLEITEVNTGFIVKGGIYLNSQLIAGEKGELPKISQLFENQYESWQIAYRNLADFYPNLIKKRPKATNYSQQNQYYEECKNTASILEGTLNRWLQTLQFQPILSLRKHLNPQQTISVVLETNNLFLRRLPWEQWQLFTIPHQLQLTICSPKFKQVNQLISSPNKENVKILAVFGDSNLTGSIQAEIQAIEQKTNVHIKWLLEPNVEKLCQTLEQETWDILFFAGHGQTEEKIGKIKINLNDWIDISQLKNSFKKAIEKGLQLAFISACDGLGVAYQLAEGEDLYLPQIIVMREVLPVAIAPQFLKVFLAKYTAGLSLETAVNEGRKFLQLEEIQQNYPCSDLLPVIIKNPAQSIPRWVELGGKVTTPPYKGLLSFKEEDQSLFFGRKKVVNELIDLINKNPLIILTGASGSGKSSVVFAGLIPSCRNQYQITYFRPTYPSINPWENLASAFYRLAYAEKVNLTEIDSTEEREIRLNKIKKEEQQWAESLQQKGINFLSEIITNIQAKNSLPILLVIDQFEELYSPQYESKLNLFLDLLIVLINLGSSNLKIVITLQAFFIEQASLYPNFGELLQKYQQLLIPLNEEELREVIINPSANLEVDFADGLVDEIVRDSQEIADNLPMLEFALTELWQKQKSGIISYISYKELGGVSQSLTDHANKVLNQLNEQQQQQARQIFIQLIQPIEKQGNKIAIRKIATESEIKPEHWELVNYFAKERLVITDFETVKKVQLSHEILIVKWDKLAQWIHDYWQLRRWQERLREDFKREDKALLEGASLDDALSFLKSYPDEIMESEREFIEKSQQKRKRKATRTLFSVIGGLAAITFLTLGVFQQREIAENRKINARLVADSLEAEALIGSGLGFEALLKAVRITRQVQGLSGVEDNTLSRLKVALQRVINNISEKARLEGHDAEVLTVRFSPDGKTIASGGADNTIKLWNLDGQEVKQTFKGHKADILSLSFSPDGKMIASADGGNIISGEPIDGVIKLWSIDGLELRTLTGHNAQVESVIFSPDGGTLASASIDGTIKLWNISDGKLIRTIEDGITPLMSISFSGDGKTIISGDKSGVVKIWDLNGNKLQSFAAHSAAIRSVSFSPDGNIILTGGEDNIIKTWNLSGTEIQKFVGHTDKVRSAKFSPDGKIIVSASMDGRVKLWNLEGKEVEGFKGIHGDRVYDVSFSPDGTLIASASADKTVKIWNTVSDSSNSREFTLLNDHKGIVSAVGFSPDGKLIASGGEDKAIRLWSRADAKLIKIFEGHQEPVFTLSFSPDGKNILSSSQDGTFRLWNLEGEQKAKIDGRVSVVVDGNRLFLGNPVSSVSFSPDGKMALLSITLSAFGASGSLIKLWSLDNLQVRNIKELRDIKEYKSTIWEAAFSPDGKVIAAASSDGTIKLLRTEDGQEIGTFKGHTSDVFSVGFSPDGKTIVSGGSDTTVRLWNLKGENLQVFKGHSLEVASVVFSPDGKRIISASSDKTVKIWTLGGSVQTLTHAEIPYLMRVRSSPDNQTIVAVGGNGKVILWDITLDSLLKRGCDRLRNYLKNNPNVSQSDRQLCDRY